MTSRSGAQREMTVLNRATIVAGDDSDRIHDGAVVMAGGRILDVRDDPVDKSEREFADTTVLDLEGDLVLPGLINGHMHAAISTPLTAAAAPAPSQEMADATRDRHLLAGATTIVNADSFTLPSEVAVASDGHPLKVEFGACPTPGTIETGISSGGELSDAHRGTSVADVLEAGAVFLGEVGSKNTLTGGIQRDSVIPETVEDITGIEIEPAEAEVLIDAVVGRHADPANQSEDEVQDALAAVGLAKDLSPAAVRELVSETIMPSVRATRKSYAEVGDFAAAYGVPVLVHTSAPTVDVTRELAERDLHLIAGHVNHPTFSHEEARSFAAELADHDDVTVEACSWDLFGDRTREGVDVDALGELFLDLVGDGVVDVVSTDYANDYWHGLLRTLQTLVDREVVSLEHAVALATGNVAEVLPSIGATRGTLEPGKAADVLVVDASDLTMVKRIYVDGTLTVADGRLVADPVETNATE